MRRALRILAATLAVLLVFCAVPRIPQSMSSAQTVQPLWNVPAGYNQHDYNKIATFLELRDENGVRNGEKCGTNYDPNDPTTWGKEGYYESPDDYIEPTTFTWSETTGEKRIMEITCYADDLVGSLDLSGCTELLSLNCARNRISALNVSQCTNLASIICSSNGISSLSLSSNPQLTTLTCDNNSLGSINVSSNSQLRYLSVAGNQLSSLNLSANTNLLMLNCAGCGLSSLNLSALTRLLGLFCQNNNLAQLNLSQLTRLQFVNCAGNGLSQLNVSANTMIVGIYCDGNELTGLDLSSNSVLSYLSCRGNRLTNLDLSATRLGVNRITAQTGGTIGCAITRTELTNQYLPEVGNVVTAVPDSGYSFTGWFNAAGAQLSTDAEFAIAGTSETVFNARFGSAPSFLLGDVNGDGHVDISDALLCMRAGMGILVLTGDAAAAADVNGDGTINISDALLCMRVAMGLVEL